MIKREYSFADFKVTSDIKTEVIFIRISKNDKKLLIKKAELTGKTISDIVRTQVYLILGVENYE